MKRNTSIMIADLLEEEKEQDFVSDYVMRSESIDPAARGDMIQWILKVRDQYDFNAATAFLSVNYMDRFLACSCLPVRNGWQLQLLAITVLSLAAKMEEIIIPPLAALQEENAQFFFDSRSIGRMEILVLQTLDWRLRVLTPFNFIDHIICNIDTHGLLTRVLNSRASQIILSSMKEISLVGKSPSSLAAAAVILAAENIPMSSLPASSDVDSLNPGFNGEKIAEYYREMKQIISGFRRSPKVLPRLRITALNRTGSGNPSAVAYLMGNKRRKLNGCFCGNDNGARD